MISKAQIKLVRSLQQKKFRDAYGYFVAEGDKCIDELKKHFELVLLVNSDNATPVEIAQMSSMRTPQGSIAVFKQIHTPYSISERSEQSILLCLDGIQDPGNLGTIIRTADWFGVRDIVCSPETADCYNPKVVQATMGALARVRVHYTDLPQWLSSLQSPQPCTVHCASSTVNRHCIPIFGTLLDGKDIYEVLSGPQPCIVHCQPSTATVHCQPCIVIMGNEGNGISQPVRKFITHPIHIPAYPKDAETSESLNVAIATAITLAEFRRPK